MHAAIVPADRDTITQNEKYISQTSLWRLYKQGGSKPQTAQSLYFTCSRSIALLSCISQRRRVGYHLFQIPTYDETLHRQQTELEFGSYHYLNNSLTPRFGLWLFKIHKAKTY